MEGEQWLFPSTQLEPYQYPKASTKKIEADSIASPRAILAPVLILAVLFPSIIFVYFVDSYSYPFNCLTVLIEDIACSA